MMKMVNGTVKTDGLHFDAKISDCINISEEKNSKFIDISGEYHYGTT